MRVSLLACLGLGLLLLGGCGQPRVSLREGPREYVAMDYDHVLTEWTRTEHLITLAALDDVLTVTATYESWDFRWAYVVRYAQDYQLTIEQRRALLETTLADTRQHHQFFVALYGPDRKWTDLTKSSSAWIARLVDDQGHETAPEEIVPIPKPGPIERTYFPYASVWRRAYRFKFPVSTTKGPAIAPNAKWFGLQFSGVQGSQQVVWHIESDRQRQAVLAP